MRHRIAGRILNRSSPHRRAMRRNMAIALFQHGAIRTTEAKAKELKPFVERLISMARKGTVHARRLVSAELGNRRGRRGRLYDEKENVQDQGVLNRLFDEIAPRYADRPGGYTRIIRLAQRRLGDAGRQVLLQLVEEAPAGGDEALASGGSRRRRRAARRREEAAGAVAEAPGGEPGGGEDEPPAAEEPPGEEQEAQQDDSPPRTGAEPPGEDDDQSEKNPQS